MWAAAESNGKHAFEVSDPLFPEGQCPRTRVRFVNSWHGYGSESDLRQVYALDGPLSRNLWPLETGTSGDRRGNDMPHLGKVIVKVTAAADGAADNQAARIRS